MKNKYFLFFVILFLFSFESCESEEESEDINSFTGTWVRLPGPSGDRTDIAIGGIAGEPENRVYMCEKKGSLTPGFFKGYLIGSSIVWDPVYKIPVSHDLSIEGSELVLNCSSFCDPTYYKRGTWSGFCGPLKNTVTKIAVGANSKEIGDKGVKSITIEGVSCPITILNSTVTSPDCSSYSYITTSSFTSMASYYTVKISFIVADVNGGYSRTDESVIYKSDLNNECNTFKVVELGGKLALSKI